MIVPWLLRAGVAVLTATAVVVGWMAMHGNETTEAPATPLRVESSLSPRTLLFGDPVTADLEVTVERRAIDPASVRIDTDFAPYIVVGETRDRRQAGDLVTFQRRFTLVCMSRECLAERVTTGVPIPVGHVHYRLRGAPEQSRAISWPATEVGTRLGGVDVFRATSRGNPWRASLAPPNPSYRVDPTLAAAGLYALALLVLGLGVLLLWPELRRLLRVTPRRKDPLSGLPPLERALALLQIALISGGPEEQRKALDRLARELRLRGNDDLAGAARRLAWSPSRPDGDELGAFAGRVAQAVGGVA